MQHSNTDSCILLKFYIKPQPKYVRTSKLIGCILLKFYIKPQQEPEEPRPGCVVSY